MTSQAVSQALEQKWAASLQTSVPYYDTINVEPDLATLPDLWGTLAYTGATEACVSIGAESACYREEGTATLVFCTRSGFGKSAALTAADAARDLYRGFTALNGNLIITAANPPQEASDRVIGDYFVVFVDLTYRFDYYK